MNILILTQQYPSDGDIYRNGFVHTRVKKYQSENEDLNVHVFVLEKQHVISEYCYDGVNVQKGDKKDLKEVLLNKSIDKVVVHFLTWKMIQVLFKVDVSCDIWVHGFEALSWKRRVFNMTGLPYVKEIVSNKLQLWYFRKFVKKRSNRKFIFVSNWMKQVAETDLNVVFDDYQILPNGIDTDFFDYDSVRDQFRKKILMIRPFNSRKYATDIAIQSIEYMEKKYSDFYTFEFTIVGEGLYFEEDTKGIREFDNVNLVNKLLNKEEIKAFHKENGIFLCPTRQDAQGVSMCEAMSSGLVPVTSYSSAIPEFVDTKVNGFLCNDIKGIAEAIHFLGNDEESYQLMSRLAREKTIGKCNLNDITKQELMIIKKV